MFNESLPSNLPIEVQEKIKELEKFEQAIDALTCLDFLPPNEMQNILVKVFSNYLIELSMSQLNKDKAEKIQWTLNSLYDILEFAKEVQKKPD